MALLGKRAAAQGRWFPSYVGIAPHVGSSTAEDARDTMRLIDDISKAFPVTWIALALQETIFEWAEFFGVKDQVEYVVYALRIASGVGGQLAAIATPAAVSAGLSGVAGLAAALPVAAAVVGIVLYITGDSDDEDLQNKRRKDAQAEINHLRDRLSLSQFASEQRNAAVKARLYAQNYVTLKISGYTAEELEKQAKTADGLAKLYDKAQNELPADQKALFESVSNLARWRGTLAAYSKLSQKEQDNFNIIGFGKYEPSLPWQLKPKIEAEAKKVAALSLSTKAKPLAMSGGSGIGTAVLLAGAGGLLYYFAPVATLGAIGMIWAGAKRAGSYVAGKAKGAVT